MKVCFTWLAVLGLAVWTVGCGSGDTATDANESAVDTNTDLGTPGGIEAGTGTTGMAPAGDDTASGEEGATGGPELP